MIGVSFKTALDAKELRLRAAVRFVDTSTLRAGPTRVARIYSNETNARKRCLVGEKSSQLVERPSVQTCSLHFSNGYPIANARQIFDGDAAAGVFGLANDCLADHVIRVAVEIPFPAPKLSEMSFGAPCPCRLQARSKLRDPRPNRERRLSRELFSVRVDCEIPDPEVDTEPALRVDGRTVWNVDGDEEEESSFSVDQIGLASYSLKPSAMVCPDGARDRKPSIEGKEADSIETILEGIESLVVWDRPVLTERAELRLVPLVDLAHFRNQSDDVLGRESESLSKLVVVESLETELVSALEFESPLRKPRARLVHADHRRQKASLLDVVDEKFDGCDKFHDIRRITSNEKRKAETALPPRPKGRGFRAGEW